MQREDLEILIWKYLDGKADEAEQREFDRLSQADASFRQLVAEARSERLGFERIQRADQANRVDAQQLENAFSRVTESARSDAARLRETAAAQRRNSEGDSVLSRVWKLLFNPLPNLVGGALGATAVVAFVLVLSPSQFANQPAEPTSWNVGDTGEFRTRGGVRETTPAQESQATATPCTCEDYKASRKLADRMREEGRTAEEADALMRAGTCLMSDPCGEAFTLSGDG